MLQPKNATSYQHWIDRFPVWAADNGAFTRSPSGFNEARFRAMLGLERLREQAARCLFVAAPDRLTVHADGRVAGDAAGTLEQFPAWAGEIRAAGFPVALVAQDGLDRMLDRVPWDLLDVLFVGGSTAWKVSDGARVCIAAARARGKRAHVGRVNSFRRLERACAMLADSADGTFLMFGPRENLPRMLQWFAKMREGVQAFLP